MKKIYSFILPVLMTLGALSADAACRSVLVTRHDGSSVRVGIETDVKAAITDGSLVFACSKGEISFPMEEVNKWTFSSVDGDGDIWSSIDISEADEVSFVFDGSRLAFRNLEPGTTVRLTAIDGRTVMETRCTDSSFFEIDLNGLSQGVYIVSYSDQSFKILMRR